MELERVQELVADYGPLAVGLGSTLDNTGVPVFFVAGMLAAASLAVPREAMLVAAFIGSVAGDLTVYVIGRYFLTKDRIAGGSFGRSFKPILDAGQRTVGRWGFWSVLFGRFVPYVGKVTPFLAGSYRVSWFQAATAVVLGSAALMGMFYLIEETAVELVEQGADTIKSISLAIGMACVVGLWWLNRTLQQRAMQRLADGEEEDAPADADAPKSRYR